MREVFANLLLILRGIWRYRWIAMATAWGLAIVGWAVVWIIPDKYESRARVYVDTESVLKPLLAGLAVSTDVMPEVNMMSTVLLSRPNLERVARETDLYLRARDAEEFHELIRGLGKKIQLTSGMRDNTYTISYADVDPQMSQRVVQTLLNTFVEDTLGLKRTDTEDAQRFLVEQIREYEQRLREAEDRLADFKRRHVGLMPGESGDYYTRLQVALAELETLRAKYRQTSERYNELTRQIEGEEPTFGLVVPPSRNNANDAKIAELREKLDELLVQYTEKHPEVIAIRETIERLERENAEGRASAAPPGTVDPSRLALRALDLNPVYQSMRIALSQTAAELAELRSQIAEQERRVGELRSRLTTIPEVEAQLAQLNRDYEVNRAQYTALVQRLESARISEQAEQSTEKIKFRIIEPPVVPLLPTGPNRPLFFAGVLVISLGAALGLGFVLHQINPVFSTRAMVRSVTGLEVLGTIGLIRRDTTAWYRRQPTLIGLTFVLLVAACIGNVVAA